MASTGEERDQTTITYVGEGRWSATIVCPEGSVEIESDSMDDLMQYARVARRLLSASSH